jgi:SAM-dependent methyltransferase
VFSKTLEQMRAAGEETRLRLLVLLAQGDLTVSELTRCLGQLQPRVSRHLSILVKAELVKPYQEGAWRFYRLADLPAWLSDLLAGLDGAEIAGVKEALSDIRKERAARAADYFAVNAQSWDELRRLHTGDAAIEEAILALAPAKTRRFADFGTGTGRMLTLFANRYGEAIGYDVSPEMLAVARVRLEEAELRHARVRQRDILKPDQIAPESADLVCLHHVLHFLAEPERAIASAADALSAGGSLLVADFAPHLHEELRERFAHRRLGFSTEDLGAMASRAGLVICGEKCLEPETEDGLVSMIWRFDKASGRSRPSTQRISSYA